MIRKFRKALTCTECSGTISEGERYYKTLLGERVCTRCLESMNVMDFIDFIGEELILVQSTEE